VNFFGTATARAKELTPEEIECQRLQREITALQFLRQRRLHDVHNLGTLIAILEDKINDRQIELARLNGTP